MVNITLEHLANGYSIGQTSLLVNVDAVSGWRLNLTDADLEVDPAGENLTFELVHTGNAYERPYFAKAGAGWNITLPDDAEDVAPFATTTLMFMCNRQRTPLLVKSAFCELESQGTTPAGSWSRKFRCVLEHLHTSLSTTEEHGMSMTWGFPNRMDRKQRKRHCHAHR